eukprot:scaffold13351_cov200-Amphora_coffeaeformis.AAC.4
MIKILNNILIATQSRKILSPILLSKKGSDFALSVSVLYHSGRLVAWAACYSVCCSAASNWYMKPISPMCMQ